MSDVLEWWPDYGHTPLVGDGGVAAPLNSLGLDESLCERLARWGNEYAEDKLPIDGAGDPAWIAEGVALLAEVRKAVSGRYEVVVTEPWWGEEPVE